MKKSLKCLGIITLWEVKKILSYPALYIYIAKFKWKQEKAFLQQSKLPGLKQKWCKLTLVTLKAAMGQLLTWAISGPRGRPGPARAGWELPHQFMVWCSTQGRSQRKIRLWPCKYTRQSPLFPHPEKKHFGFHTSLQEYWVVSSLWLHICSVGANCFSKGGF